ncbi:MAG: 4Fe-4S binding protein [Candidatus Krumholzibacteriota bacterium]|nr:4Fe-4S binding protein [Candidatus Krumholzibacteriota bacterium]
MAVSVDESKCTGCGICADICPVGAVTVEGVAGINEALCTGCGACVAECPRGAISSGGIGSAREGRTTGYPPFSPLPSAGRKRVSLPLSSPHGKSLSFRTGGAGSFKGIFGSGGGSGGRGGGPGRGGGRRGGGAKGRGRRRR